VPSDNELKVRKFQDSAYSLSLLITYTHTHTHTHIYTNAYYTYIDGMLNKSHS